MIITIDNLDGNGPVDYSTAVSANVPLVIERVLNKPSRCTGAVHAGPASFSGSGVPLPLPVRLGRIIATTDSGSLLFTGYLATEAVPVYAGAGLAGPVYSVAFTAISDEWLLDKQIATLGGGGFAQYGGELLATLTTRAGAALLTTNGVQNTRQVGVFTPELTAPWSTNAATIAGSAYASYRVLNGALTLQPAGAVTHTLNFDSGHGGTLQVASLKTAMVKELANDVTVSGAIEPDAYVSETFACDGSTTVFTLSDQPFRPSVFKLLNDSFDQGAFNRQIWRVNDTGGHLGFSANGLTLSGGNGFDGQNTLVAIDAMEMGGALLIEAGSVQLDAASDGVLCGLYSSAPSRTNCFAGYNVRQSGGSTVVTPLVNGVEVGTTYTVLSGHRYTLRIRLHCVEVQRVLQTYYARVDGVVEAFGGGLVDAPMSLVFDFIDLDQSSNTPATVLYDGSVATSPASCAFALVDSVQLFGSIGFCRVTQTGSAWIVSTLPSGALETRLVGAAGQGDDCTMTSAGKITFVSGRIPVPNERITVSYRLPRRSIARLEDAASVAEEAAGGGSGTARWLGKVIRPPARSSVDCESAADAVLSLAASRAAAIAGSYAASNPGTDIWPGDVLSLVSGGQTANVVVRKVTVEDKHLRPEDLTYKVAFANDWAESLGVTLSESIAHDALLPNAPSTGPGGFLPNLPQLGLVDATDTALQVDAGMDPPAGGGFEVRRRDGDFGPGVDQDLVLRSPVRSFSIPRSSQIEHFYIRTYDASTPPLYSRNSSAVFINLPVA